MIRSLRRPAATTPFVVALLVAGPALAGNVEEMPSGGFDTIVAYTATAGERNDLSLHKVRVAGGFAVLVRDTAGVAAGDRCLQIDARTARCEPFALRVVLGDGDDRLRTRGDLEVRALGGDGDDRLAAGSEDSKLLGGRGLDVLLGGRGFDVLRAGRGRDRDVLRGGRGSDRLFGNAGRNRIDAGRGIDFVRAGGGRDRVRARDRSPDTVDCGRGGDRVIVDRLDWFGAACERANRRSAAAVPLEDDPELPLGDFSPASLELRIGCPWDGPRACVGAASIVRRGRRRAREAFRLARGHRRTLHIDASNLGSVVRVRIVVRSRDQRGRLVTRAIRGSIERRSIRPPPPPSGEG
jgi:RTX calcium-binding nonapeptide repeat (4 copies)